MTTLKSLTQTAMLGTGNGFTPPTLQRVRLPDDDPEASLLTAAAVIGIGEIGGQKPLQLETNVQACAAESSLQMPERAAGLLKRILMGEFEALLPEFLQMTAAGGLVAPPETLPSLLGMSRSELHPLILPVIGRRGRWLAEQNPAWAYALERETQDAWELGTLFERAAALERIRASEPGRARQWVQAGWEQDAPEHRAAFIATFEIGLSMEDEPILEACLDDKRKEVREAAKRLLLRLEHSRFVQRIWARAKPLFRLKSKFLGGDKLEVGLPEDLDQQAKRDGIGGPALRKKMGEKANALAQMVSNIPPALWSREFGKPPEKLISVAVDCEWKEPVLLGWQLAAQRTRDRDWAEGIVIFWATQAEGQQILDLESINESILLMRQEKVEALVNATIMPPFSELDDKSLLIPLLVNYRHPWTDRMARVVVHCAQRQSGKYGYNLPAALPAFALYIPPELAVEFAAGWDEEPKGAWRENINKFLMILNFRNEIRQSLIR